LEGFNPKEEIVLIARVGVKNKIEILKKCIENKYNVSNVKSPEGFIKEVEDNLNKKKKEIKDREEKRKKTKEKALKKKEEKKEEEKTEEEKEETKKGEKSDKIKILEKREWTYQIREGLVLRRWK